MSEGAGKNAVMNVLYFWFAAVVVFSIVVLVVSLCVASSKVDIDDDNIS